jgi:DNA-directed RNA polymerase specialized sigma24 family protein
MTKVPGRYGWASFLRLASAVRSARSRLLPNQRSTPPQLTFDEFAAEVFTQLREIPEHRALQDPVATLGRLAEPLARRTPASPPLVPAEVDLIISELPDVTRAVLSLHLRRNLHFRQIAESLGIPADIALAHLRDALAHLRKRLGDRDG